MLWSILCVLLLLLVFSDAQQSNCRKSLGNCISEIFIANSNKSQKLIFGISNLFLKVILYLIKSVFLCCIKYLTKYTLYTYMYLDKCLSYDHNHGAHQGVIPSIRSGWIGFVRKWRPTAASCCYECRNGTYRRGIHIVE